MRLAKRDRGYSSASTYIVVTNINPQGDDTIRHTHTDTDISPLTYARISKMLTVVFGYVQ